MCRNRLVPRGEEKRRIMWPINEIVRMVGGGALIVLRTGVSLL
jgi:hypothetical protein